MPIGSDNGQQYPDAFAMLAAPYQKEKELPNIEDVPHQDWVENTFKKAWEALKLPGDVASGKASPMDIERANDLAGLMVFGPAPVASKMVDGTLGSFAGVRARTLDKGALQTAQDAVAQGVHPDEVWQKTGFFQGAEGRWKFEIPDKNARLKENGFEINTINDPRTGGELNTVYTAKPGQKLEDILEHPDLYEAYPFLKNINITEHNNPNSIASANISENRISFSKDLNPEYLRGVILHEVQHFIQAHEGFSSGASSKAFAELSPTAEIAYQKYRRVQGEVEARNVQTRRQYDEQQRTLNSPRFTEDTPRFLQIPSEDVPNVSNSEVTNFRRAANDNRTFVDRFMEDLPKYNTTQEDLDRIKAAIKKHEDELKE